MARFCAGFEEQIIQTIQRRLDSMRGSVSKETKRRRVSDWMLRRGHSWDVVNGVMRQVTM